MLRHGGELRSWRERTEMLFLAGSAVFLIAACGGGSKSAATTTTTTSAPSTSAPSTTVAPTAGRGLTGVVTIVAGNGSDDGKGVPGPAAEASLGSKVNFTPAPNGDVFVTNGTVDVLKISGGQLSKFAQLAPDEAATGGVALGPDGSLFVATGSKVVKIAADGTSSVLLTAAAAGLSTSLGPIAVDTTGNVYIADGLRRVTRIAPDGSTTLIAGTGVQAKPDTAEGDGGPATAAPLGAPAALAIDPSGNLLIADTSAHRVRRVAPDGTITTIAGGGTVPFASVSGGVYAPDGTKATDLQLSDVSGVAVDAKGRVYVADGQSRGIFRFGPSGAIELVIGDQKGASETAGEAANATRATNVGAMAIDAKGNLLYLDAGTLKQIAGAGS